MPLPCLEFSGNIPCRKAVLLLGRLAVKNGVKLLLILALFFVTSGCVKYHPKPISSSENAAALEARSLNIPELKQFLETNLHHPLASWPLKTWDFPTLTLVAFYYHPDLDVARAKWGVAKAAIKTAGGRPNPTISFVPEYATNSDIGTSPYLFGFSFDIPIETAGKRGYRMAKAEHESDAARLNIAMVAWQVRSRLRTSLLNLYAARQAEGVLNRQLILLKDNLRILKDRISQEALSPLAFNEAELQINQTLINLREEQKKYAEARVQVASALGLPVSAIQSMKIDFKDFDRLPVNPTDPEIRRQALLNRPDILASLQSYAATESALQLEIAKQYPDIHISPGYNFDQGENKWVLGISITPPLFNQNQGPIAEAQARRKEAAANFNALQARILGDTDQSLAGYLAVLKKWEAAQTFFATEKDRLHFIKESTREGEIRRVALFQGQMDLNNAVLTRLSAFFEAQQSLGLLEDALQSPLQIKSAKFEIPETNPRDPEEESAKTKT